MRRVTKSIVVPLMALAAMVMFASFSRAEDAKPANGTITGKVVDADGKPVSAALVQLAVAPNRTTAPSGGDTNAHANANADKKLAPADAGNDSGNADKAKGDKARGGMRNLNIIGSTNTDGDGKFTFSNIQPGDYLVVTNVRGQGRAREKVTLASGESKELELKLAAPKARGAGK